MQTFRTQIFLFICCIISLVMCSCQEGWKSFDSSCYKFSANTANWQDARNACLNIEADLAVVRNQEENDFLYKSYQKYNNFWIGLTDRKEEGHFMWIDNGECSNFLHFANPEPNGHVQENCIEFYGTTGEWNDQNCKGSHRYLCEKYQDNTPPSYGSSCPDDIHVLFSSRSASVAWIPPRWNDNSFCDPNVTSSHFPGHVIAIPEGDSSAFINVTYTANDKAGNSETCYFRVTASYPGDPNVTPDSSGHPGLQTPGSSRYPGLTIGMFFVGIIIGVFGVLAGSLGYNRIKRIPSQTSQTYIGYVAEGHDESNKHTYEDLQHKTEEVATYVNSNIKPHNITEK